jgi:spore coat protein U-like protein
MNKQLTRLIGATTLTAAIVAASPAQAVTTPGSLDVSATVTANCALSTSAVAFGNVDVTSGANNDAAGSISVTCTNGTAWTASADAGAGTGASLASRKMNDGASNLLNYVLYTDSSRTNVWGDGVGGTTALVSGDGTGTADTRTIYGRIPSGQTGVPSGIYGDTVAVTVTY